MHTAEVICDQRSVEIDGLVHDHPRLQFEPVLTYDTLQMLTTYLLTYPNPNPILSPSGVKIGTPITPISVGALKDT